MSMNIQCLFASICKPPLLARSVGHRCTVEDLRAGSVSTSSVCESDIVADVYVRLVAALRAFRPLMFFSYGQSATKPSERIVSCLAQRRRGLASPTARLLQNSPTEVVLACSQG